MNENEEKIYDLISSKSFTELTEDEKVLALESLGSEELYEKMREANQAAEEAMSDDVAPPPEMKESVMAAFDERDEKRGIVWWKYAAAVVLLAVGAFVFWPSSNLDREPIAENVERKDSTAEKKSAPPKEEEFEQLEKVEVAEIENKAQTEIPEPTTLSKSAETAEKVNIEITEISPKQEDISDEMMAFAEDDSESDDANLAEKKMDDMADYPGIDIEKDEEVEAPTLANSDLAYDSAPASTNQSLRQNLSVESARSAANMGTTLSTAKVTLKDIGGYSSKSYVAY